MIFTLEPKSKDLYCLSSEDGRETDIHMAVLDKCCLWERREISEEEFTEVLKTEAAFTLRAKALALLDRRSHSRKELFDKLYKYESDRELRNMVLDEFEELGLINDEDYAAACAHYYMQVKRCSLRAAEQKMRFVKGIPEKYARAALKDYLDMEQENLDYVFERKYSRRLGDADDRKTTDKVKAALARLGFHYEDIDLVIKNYFEEAEDED